jgi:phosphate transport system ATP-binding protein
VRRDPGATSREDAGTTPERLAPAPTVSAGAPASTPRRSACAVRLEGLSAWYGDMQSIKDLSLTFAPNQATALIGPSGSGKSTVVRCINRMHEEIVGARAAGRVLLDDVDVYDAKVDVVAVRRSIGMVFQKPNPFPTMSIFDNVAAGLRLTARKASHEQVETALRGAGLWDEVKDRLGRPGIGLSALDPISTLKIEELVEELKARITIVIVTHNMQQAARVADATAFMLNGELVEYGPTEKIFTNPDDSRTEEYVTGKFG